MIDTEDPVVIDPVDPPEVAEVEGEALPTDPPEGEELVITLGDEATAEEDDAAKAPTWVRDLRKSNREKDRRIRELEQRVQAPPPAAVVVGEKPTLQGCTYDESDYERQIEAWHERKATADADTRKQADVAKQASDAWQARLNSYGSAKAALKVADFEDAEDASRESFSVVQQSVILKGVRSAEKAAQLIYALGKSPKKRAELAAITDPVEFAVAIGEVLPMLKTQARKTAPIPERTVRGSAPGAGALDNALVRLEAEADKTGDRTKVAAYRREQMLKQRAA